MLAKIGFFGNAICNFFVTFFASILASFDVILTFLLHFIKLWFVYLFVILLPTKKAIRNSG